MYQTFDCVKHFCSRTVIIFGVRFIVYYYYYY